MKYPPAPRPRRDTTVGKVTFVGAGCGDSRLLTLRALDVLSLADFVLFDADVHPDVLGRLREGARRQAVIPSMTAEDIATLLADEAAQGGSAVRLTWGDPLLFGWGDVEGAAVARHRVPLEVVPGIGPLNAIGAFAGIPLTRSSDASPSVAAVRVTRGHETLHDWQKLATATDTLAIVCDAGSVAETARNLAFYGRSTTEKVTVVQSLSRPSQIVIETTLGELPLMAQSQSARVVMVVGERATPMPALTWLSNLPLFGKRVLVTRARDQAGSVAGLLRACGADPVVVPTIEIHPPTDPSAMMDAVPSMHERYGWILFTSANGVDALWAEIKRQGRDARAFGRAKIAAVGPGTAAALERCGITPDVVPKEHRGEAIAAEVLAAMGTERKSVVLLARAEVARDVVPDTLRAAGCQVDVVSVYKTQSPPRQLLEALASLLRGGELDVVTLTSSSTVEHLCDALGAPAAELLARTCVVSIGPVTTQTAKKRGINVDVTAADSTVAGLVAALETHFAK